MLNIGEIELRVYVYFYSWRGVITPLLVAVKKKQRMMINGINPETNSSRERNTSQLAAGYFIGCCSKIWRFGTASIYPKISFNMSSTVKNPLRPPSVPLVSHWAARSAPMAKPSRLRAVWVI